MTPETFHPATTKATTTFIIEHLDPELEDWQVLEYRSIADECKAAGSKFLLSGLASVPIAQEKLRLPLSNLTQERVENLYPVSTRRVCLLDPKGEQDFDPTDREKFDVFVFGGILGDDPPRDRTADLRKLGYTGRRLGPEQMTTDTAVRVTRTVLFEQKRLNNIDYINRPEISISSTEDSGPDESVTMPFKYVRSPDEKPILPKGMVDLLARDADKDILDLL